MPVFKIINMKIFNARVLFPVLIFSAILFEGSYISGGSISSETGFIGEDKPKVTADLLNGSPAFYKTYEDFARGTGQKWTYVSMNASPTFNNQIAKISILFKDEAGKHVKVTPEDFWGWRSVDGKLYRNGDFVNGKITKFPFSVNYVTPDFIVYNPESINNLNVQVSPHEWYSEDLKSAISGENVYFKNHDKVTYDKIGKLNLAISKSVRTMATGKEWKKARYEAYQNSADIVCFYMETGFNKGNYTK